MRNRHQMDSRLKYFSDHQRIGGLFYSVEYNAEAIESLDIKEMSKAERLKLIQIGIQYVIPRLKQVEEITDEMPTNFQIEIIDRLGKYKDRDLDKAIKNL